jgi:hypothetical protein
MKGFDLPIRKNDTPSIDRACGVGLRLENFGRKYAAGVKGLKPVRERKTSHQAGYNGQRLAIAQCGA